MVFIPNIPIGNNQKKTSSSWMSGLDSTTWQAAIEKALAAQTPTAPVTNQPMSPEEFLIENATPPSAPVIRDIPNRTAPVTYPFTYDPNRTNQSMSAEEFLIDNATPPSVPVIRDIPNRSVQDQNINSIWNAIEAATPPQQTGVPSNNTGLPTSAVPAATMREWKKSPAYMAFLRQKGLIGAGADRVLAAVRQQVEASMARSGAEFDLAEKNKVFETNTGFEERGMFKSGARLQAVAKAKDVLALQEASDAADQTQLLTDAVLDREAVTTELAVRESEEELAAKEWATTKNA